MRAFLLLPDHGAALSVGIPDSEDGHGQLAVLQHLVGGYIENVSFAPATYPRPHLYVNEEGRLEGRGRNQVAEDLVNHVAGDRGGFRAVLCGPAVLLEMSEDGFDREAGAATVELLNAAGIEIVL